MPSRSLSLESGLPSVDALSDAWGEHLAHGHPTRPDWFVTLTYKGDIGEWGCIQRFKQFVKRVRHLIGHQPTFVRVTESHRNRPTPHHHCLFYDCRDRDGVEPNRQELEDYCWNSFGKVQVQRYDPTRDAAGYLAKYVTKGDGLQLSLSFSRDWGKEKERAPMLDL